MHTALNSEWSIFNMCEIQPRVLLVKILKIANPETTLNAYGLIREVGIAEEVGHVTGVRC